MKLRTVALLAAAFIPAGAATAAASQAQPPVREFALRDGEQRGSVARAASADRAYVSRVLATPRRFNLVGVGRVGKDAKAVSVRARHPSGEWTRWTQVLRRTEGPDIDSPETGPGKSSSIPVWVGQGDAVQYKLRRSQPSRTGLTLHFVNTTGTATAADRRRTAMSELDAPHLSPDIARHVAETTNAPPIVPRSAWDPRNTCKPRRPPAYGRVTMAIVHHTEMLDTYSRAQAPAVVLAICRFHRNARRWSDIGYDFLVDRYGQIFEGRAGGIDRAVIGAHAMNFNSVSTGIANMGDFTEKSQTQAGTAALIQLLAWTLDLHDVPMDKPTRRIVGHRNVNPTECPGEGIYGRLPAIRQAVASLLPR